MICDTVVGRVWKQAEAEAKAKAEAEALSVSRRVQPIRYTLFLIITKTKRRADKGEKLKMSK